MRGEEAIVGVDNLLWAFLQWREHQRPGEAFRNRWGSGE